MSDLTSSSFSYPTIHADIKDKYDHTAVDCARREGYNDIVELITNHKSPPKGELHMTVMSDLDRAQKMFQVVGEVSQIIAIVTVAQRVNSMASIEMVERVV